MCIFLSSFFTEAVGVHAIFGSFLLGLATPQQHPATLRLAKTIEDFAVIVLLPLYFAASGLKTELSSITSGTAVLLLLMVLVIATVGKFVGCALAARLGGWVRLAWGAAGRGWLQVLSIGVDA